MAWRAIQDTVPYSESLNAVTAGAERLYWRLLSQVDGYGRLAGSVTKIRARCVPLLGATDLELEGWLTELEQVKRILRYAVDEVVYIQIVNFDENQPKEFRRKRGESKIPEPTEEVLQMGLVPPLGRTMAEKGGLDRDREGEREEKEIVKGSPTAEVAIPELPDSQNVNSDGLDLMAIAASLRGSDEGTEPVLGSLRRVLPEAAFHRALEALEERKANHGKPALVSEAKFVVRTLQRMVEEGQYA